MFPSKIWREFPQRYRLEAAKCKKCGKVFFPPRLICDKCKHREFEKVSLPWEGTLLTFTVIRVGPAAFTDQTPYALGIIDVGDGVKLTCQIVDVVPEKLQAGQKLRLEFRRIQKNGLQGALCYGYKAVPCNRNE
jgi:uncharacterized OB-fold protein